ncbi:ParB N-terminal domain-containing protein [Phyllobacterium leguminum]|uniref:ParB family chromosome partitioning protein n=1 Tax=Phyllobacterium leguminum TaxID=314237 RepID=A0A318T497_9HYPH|nr:ParB N-terminal domain-containing protein [Phyllobacterium leguminum]PYE87534.1 ParB family chromosome partitioning protein [Phyllobacterium leguminum]
MTTHVNVAIPEIRISAIQDIKLSDIDIPDNRARSFDQDEAGALAFIIAASGLQHPIRVRLVGDRFRLIAGRKRLEAFRMLAWEMIPATISTAATDDEARLEEVMENLGRHELKVLDRCHHLFELKQVYERLYPDAKHGGDRGNQHTGGKTQKLRLAADSDEVFGFAAATADKISLSRRSIELAVKIWKDLSDASRKRCAGTWLADHQAGLKQLAEQSHADQAKVLDILFSDPPKATNVSDALTIIAHGVVLTPTEKKVDTVKNTLRAMPDTVVAAVVDERLAEMQNSITVLSKFFAKLEDAELDKVVEQHEERIVASLQRRGRI